MADLTNDSSPQQLSPEEIEKISELVQEFFATGGTLKDLKKLDDQQMDAVYHFAFQLYQNGKYQEAREAFRFLVFFDHYKTHYLLGLGACEQMLENYQRAIECYSHIGILTGLKDPVPAMHAAECHLALGNLKEAASGFRYAHGLAAEDPKQQAVATRSATLLEQTEARIAKEYPDPDITP